MNKYNNIWRGSGNLSINKQRINITEFLQWNDRNGSYTDENCDLEEIPRMTYEDTIKYFFGVMNDDFYYKITDNKNYFFKGFYFSKEELLYLNVMKIYFRLIASYAIET